MEKRTLVRRLAIVLTSLCLSIIVITAVALMTSSVSLLHWAAQENHPMIVKALLMYGVGVNSKDNNGRTPLFPAVESGSIDMAQFLVLNGADVYAKDDKGVSLLWTAIDKQQNNMINFLLEHGVALRSSSRNEDPPLQHACKIGAWTITRALLLRGADPNVHDRSGRTPLIEAALKGDTLSARLLLDNGADVNAQDNAGWTALYAAAYTAAYNAIDPTTNQTVLPHYVAAAKLLLARGAAVNMRADDGTTPLHIIVRMRARQLLGAPSNELELVKLLLEHKANVNCIANNGVTPLHEAVWYCDTKLVETLLRAGARGNIPNSSGQTAWDYNLAHPYTNPHRKEIEQKLSQYAAVNNLPAPPDNHPGFTHTAMLNMRSAPSPDYSR